MVGEQGVPRLTRAHVAGNLVNGFFVYFATREFSVVGDDFTVVGDTPNDVGESREAGLGIAGNPL